MSIKILYLCFPNFKIEVHLIKVIIQDTESLDKALKRFKKKYEKAGILKEFRRRQFFVKPSVEKKMNKERAIRKSKRIVEEENT